MDDLLKELTNDDVKSQFAQLIYQLSYELPNMTDLDQYSLLSLLNTTMWSYIKTHYDSEYKL